MRHTQGNLAANELDEVLVNPFQERTSKIKRYRLCLLSIWALTNVVTFTFGYYVKSAFNDDDCSILENGSM